MYTSNKTQNRLGMLGEGITGRLQGQAVSKEQSALKGKTYLSKYFYNLEF